MTVAALLFALITFVPLDDRPVTQQLPQLLGRIAGDSVVEPPRSLLGSYLTFGRPDAIAAWLNSAAPKNATALVVSADMLAYGGLIASRVPGTSYADAWFRLQEFAQLRTAHPSAWIAAFGTIMRLAPTGIPAVGPAARFFAPYPIWQYLQDYANLHDPPLRSEMLRARHLEQLIGAPTLQAYLQTRARNVAVDMREVELVDRNAISTLVLGQDDAGPVGLHVKDVAALQRAVAQDDLQSRVAIEPGADELGMAMIANAIVRRIGWVPRVAVSYSTPAGAAYNDPLEFAPIGVTIADLVRLCGAAVSDGSSADLDLFVRVPGTTAAQDAALLSEIEAAEADGQSVAFADLTFLENTFADQSAFAQTLLSTGAASKLDAYASWNTDANTVGTALAEAIAAGAGRRAGSYDALAHRTFTFNRMLDDFVFHDEVRPQLNAQLEAAGITNHSYLLPEQAQPIERFNSAALWNRGAQMLKQLYPNDHIAAMRITLPWNRTFETEIDAALAPNLKH